MNEAVAQDLYETINRNVVRIAKLQEQNKEMLEVLNECRELFCRNKRRYVDSHQWEKAGKAREWERILKRLIEKGEGEQNGD